MIPPKNSLEIAAYKILQGARGDSAIDFETMKKILQHVQCLFAAFPQEKDEEGREGVYDYRKESERKKSFK